MCPRNKKILPAIDARLAGYATLAGVALAAPSLTKADIVYSGPVSINIPSTTAGVYLNVVTGVNNTSPAAVPGWDFNPYSSTALNVFSSTGTGGNATALGGVGPYVGSGSTYSNLAFGTLISGASTFAGTGVNTVSAGTPLNLNSSNNLVGFRFFNEATSAVNYGWVRISLSGTAQAQPRAIVEYAYDNAGGGIGAGVIPEPATTTLLGAMALGALGLRAWRKQKAA